jgi:dihydroorotate dehydrogenase
VPDWFYRTVAQPALFRLPDRVARGAALGLMGVLGKSRAGRALIDFLGHMHADPRLAARVAGTLFPSPVGLGWRVDPERRATRALQRFGVGCVEWRESGRRAVVRGPGRCLHDGDEAPGTGGEARDFDAADGPVLRRSERADGTERVRLPSGVELPVVAWDEAAANTDAHGVVLQVGGREPGGGWRVQVTMPAELPGRVRAWRERLGADGALIVAGGVGEPSEAVALVEAGASLVLVDAGLVFNGPGLVKRCNEALLARRTAEATGEGTRPAVEDGVVRRAWFWGLMLGAALAGGGLLTLALAFGRVLLPYDEQFLGFTAEVLRRNSPKLHAFMAHDRGTLAGAMLGLGWLYAVLAWRGIRHGAHGAKTALAASALTGFASFFSFLGFGYFDTLHAFVAAVLFQLTVQLMTGLPGGAAPEVEAGCDDEDPSWRRAQWGQLCWVVHAAGLIVAGLVILAIGMTKVFVSEDLAFLCLDEGQARALGERVLSVVAHDRATLGGMLLASGVGMLLPVLWCHRRGAAWVWWAIAGLGAPAYAATLGMHAWVGYTDWRHMAPALAGLGLWAAGLYLGREYLLGRGRVGGRTE